MAIIVTLPPTSAPAFVSEAELAELALDRLRRILPPRWAVEASPQTSPTGEQALHLAITPPSGSATSAIVDVRKSLSPDGVRRMLDARLTRALRLAAGNKAIVVIAPHLSRRTRELLEEEEIGYMDLTGNIRVTLDYPGVFINVSGTDRNPGRREVRRGLSGSKAGAIVRVMVDSAPPFSVADVAKTTGLDAGYVSRTLAAMAAEALITRGARGRVIDVDWPALIRRRAESVDLLTPGRHRTFVSPNGAGALLADLDTAGPTVTGSFAAVRVAPVTAPTLLVAYTSEIDRTASKYKLLPASEGADVALVNPSHSSILLGERTDDGKRWAALSQVAIDCLSGPGRMAAEGEALISWMIENEATWRTSTIDALASRWRA